MVGHHKVRHHKVRHHKALPLSSFGMLFCRNVYIRHGNIFLMKILEYLLCGMRCIWYLYLDGVFVTFSLSLFLALACCFAEMCTSDMLTASSLTEVNSCTGCCLNFHFFLQFVCFFVFFVHTLVSHGSQLLHRLLPHFTFYKKIFWLLLKSFFALRKHCSFI